jgi:hypothetical protein
MYPVTCKDGSEHYWVEKDSGFECRDCGIDLKTFEAVSKDYKKVTEVIQNMANILNGGDAKFVSEAMFEAMQHTHRTLQQNIIRTIAAFLARMSTMDTDLRNQASVEWCKEVAKVECLLPLI